MAPCVGAVCSAVLRCKVTTFSATVQIFFALFFVADALCVAYQEVAEGFGVLLLQCHVAVRLL